ncbi:CLUMA_CG000579, isoform A [Clunio marinus]|uniref:CLUMA_CG000579, isoform A n=1 Tax=Clunio marinus TaxID=568069 RepID=A0A1J1HGR7_9DIPT|nr:CLUMA_CG000579, isoform A [Clunio marinus]
MHAEARSSHFFSHHHDGHIISCLKFYCANGMRLTFMSVTLSNTMSLNEISTSVSRVAVNFCASLLILFSRQQRLQQVSELLSFDKFLMLQITLELNYEVYAN